MFITTEVFDLIKELAGTITDKDVVFLLTNPQVNGNKIGDKLEVRLTDNGE